MSVRLAEPVEVRVFQVPPSASNHHSGGKAQGLFARVPLHLCLGAICDADPRLLPSSTTSSKDTIVKALHPANTLRQQRAANASSSHRSNTPNHPSSTEASTSTSQPQPQPQPPRTPSFAPTAPTPPPPPHPPHPPPPSTSQMTPLLNNPFLALLPSPAKPRPGYPSTPGRTAAAPCTPHLHESPKRPPSKGVFDACGLLSVALADTSTTAPCVTATVRPAHEGDSDWEDQSNASPIDPPCDLLGSTSFSSDGNLRPISDQEQEEGAEENEHFNSSSHLGLRSSIPPSSPSRPVRQRDSTPATSFRSVRSVRSARPSSPTTQCRDAGHAWALDLVLKLESTDLSLLAQQRRDQALDRIASKLTRSCRSSVASTRDMWGGRGLEEKEEEEEDGDGASSIPSAPSIPNVSSPASGRSLSVSPEKPQVHSSPVPPTRVRSAPPEPSEPVVVDGPDPDQTLRAPQRSPVPPRSRFHAPNGSTDQATEHGTAQPTAAAQLLAQLDSLQNTSDGGQALANLASLLSQALGTGATASDDGTAQSLLAALTASTQSNSTTRPAPLQSQHGLTSQSQA